MGTGCQCRHGVRFLDRKYSILVGRMIQCCHSWGYSARLSSEYRGVWGHNGGLFSECAHWHSWTTKRLRGFPGNLAYRPGFQTRNLVSWTRDSNLSRDWNRVKVVKERHIYSFERKWFSKGNVKKDTNNRLVDDVSLFVKQKWPIISTCTLVFSVFLSLGSIFLLADDKNYNPNSKKEFLLADSVPSDIPNTTDGEASAAVEAFSVGETVSPGSLLLRYAFDESDVEDSLELQERLRNERNRVPFGETDLSEKVSKTTEFNVTNALQKGKSSDNRTRMRLIGKGAYGRVVRAVNRQTRQKVAMKVVSKGAMTAEALLEEIEVLQRVRGHDNVIHLIDVLYCENRCYVVTELCEGGEILEHLIVDGPFSEEEASVILNKTNSALHHIHKCGFVHLDIKPENLVFSNYKSGDDVRVIDFGMARKISECAGNLCMVNGEKGSRMGTLAYWSPEQVASVVGPNGEFLDDIDRLPVKSDPRACDMWALGVVLYIMLLGCHPFDPYGTGDKRKIAKAILRKEYSFDLHGDALKLSSDAKNLISGLLDPNPETRFKPSDVSAHRFISKVSANKEMDHQHVLPSSWMKQGFTVDRNDPTSRIIEEKCLTDVRLQKFAGERSGDAFVRALLMAGARYGGKLCTDLTGDNSNTTESLFFDAYNVFKLNKEGKLLHKHVEDLLRITGDEAEDEVVVSYHETAETNTRNAERKKMRNSSLNAIGKDNSSSDKICAISPHSIDFLEFKAFLRRMDCVTRSFSENEVVFEQGGIPQGVYFLLNGQARLEQAYAMGSSSSGSYATLTPGSIFGEVACIHGAKTRRSTVRCTMPSEVLFIPKDLFLRALAGSPALKDAIFTVAMKQQAIRLHELVSFLQPENLIVRRLSPGDSLYRQGEKADCMYLIREGIVGSSITAPYSRAHDAGELHLQMSERGAGDIIGTSAATGGGGVRNSSTICITPVTAVGIPENELTRLRKEEPVFRFYLENLLKTRREFWQGKISNLERGVSEPQLLPLLLKSEIHNTTSSLAKVPAAADVSKELTRTNPVSETDRSLTTLTKSGTIVRKMSFFKPIASPNNSNGEGTWDLLGRVASFFNPYSWITSEPPGVKKAPKRLEAFQEHVAIVQKMKPRRYSVGEYVYNGGDSPSNFFVVDSGTVSVQYLSEDGDVLKVALLGPGDHFGEQVLLEGISEYTTSVQCLSDATILTMPKNEFLRLVNDKSTHFSTAIQEASKFRQHRWARNILKLAKEDKRRLRQEGNAKKLKNSVIEDQPGPFVQIEQDENENQQDTIYVDRDRDFGNNSTHLNKYGVVLKPEETVSETSQGVHRMMLQAGDSVFSSVGKAEAVYLVHKGEISVQFITSRGREKRILGPGDTFGLERLLPGGAQTCESVALSSNTIVSKIPWSVMDELAERHDYVSNQLRRHARRTVPMNELERMIGVAPNGYSSYSSLVGMLRSGKGSRKADQ